MAYFKNFLTKEEVLKLSSCVTRTVTKDGKDFQEVISANFDRMDIFAGSIYYMLQGDRLMMLVVEYKPDGRASFVKFPGGISLPADNEKITETCIRESQEECGFRPILESSELIYWKYSSADHLNCHHWKAFFLHHKKTGSLRSVSSSDHGENSPAKWMPAEEVARKIHHTHWVACKRAIESICKRLNGSTKPFAAVACWYAYNEGVVVREKQLAEYFAAKDERRQKGK